MSQAAKKITKLKSATKAELGAKVTSKSLKIVKGARRENLCIIGFGNMGAALYRGLHKNPNADYSFSIGVRDAARMEELKGTLGCEVSTRLSDLAAKADIIIVCVKPQQALQIVRDIKPKLKPSQILISICAGLSLADLRSAAGAKISLVRVMPNTPCLIGKGVSVLCPEPGLDKSLMLKVEKIFDSMGTTVILEESLMDGATGISGCGPAYLYMIIDALSDAGVKVGLNRKVATLLAAQTFLGASAMVLERDEHPATLKDEVTTPAGITIDALMALEEGKLRVTLIKAVVAAAEKSRLLTRR